MSTHKRRDDLLAQDRLVRAGDLVGAAEIATRLHLAHVQTVHSWRRRYSDFPKPLTTLKQALVWSWPDIEAWARGSGRLD